MAINYKFAWCPTLVNTKQANTKRKLIWFTPYKVDGSGYKFID